MKEVSRDWLKAATDDLETIAKIIDHEHLTNIVAFHAQQAVEKSLKAVIEEYGLEITKIHSLARLVEITRPYLSMALDDTLVETLDRLYIDARYPGELGLLPSGKPSRNDAKRFSDFANRIYDTVYQFLEKKKT